MKLDTKCLYSLSLKNRRKVYRLNYKGGNKAKKYFHEFIIFPACKTLWRKVQKALEDINFHSVSMWVCEHCALALIKVTGGRENEIGMPSSIAWRIFLHQRHKR